MINIVNYYKKFKVFMLVISDNVKESQAESVMVIVGDEQRSDLAIIIIINQHF